MREKRCAGPEAARLRGPASATNDSIEQCLTFESLKDAKPCPVVLFKAIVASAQIRD
jgi:hypothetical protein